MGLVVLIGCFGATRLMRRRHVLIAGGLALGVAVVVFALGGDDLADQFEQQGLRSPRFEAYQRIGRAIGDTPWLGTGYGTFAEVYRGYQVGATREFWNHGHHTYLENALELGVLPAAALTGAIGWLAVQCGRALQRRRRNALYPCLGVAATTLVGLHALLDFSLEIPAVSVTYAAVLGVAIGRARWRDGRDLDYRAMSSRSWPHRRALGLAAVADNCLLVLAMPRLGADLTAVPLTLVHRQLEAQAMPSISAFDRAIVTGRAAAAWANAGDNWWRVGLAELALAQQPEMAAHARLARLERAEHALRLSLAAAPVNPTAWTQLAYVGLVRGDYALVSDALALSVRTGPSLGPLMPLRSSIAALAWEQLHPSAKALFEIQFVKTVRFAPQQFVEAIRRNDDATTVAHGQLEAEPDLRAKFDHLLLTFRSKV